MNYGWSFEYPFYVKYVVFSSSQIVGNKTLTLLSSNISKDDFGH